PPANIRYDTGRLPFDSGRVELSAGFPNDRLLRVVLRPTAAYEVPEGVTAVRGTLVASEAAGAKPVADAIVQLAWATVQPAGWIPPVPASRARLRPGEAITDKDGQFLVLSRLPGKSATASGYVGYPLPGEPGYDGARISLDVSGAGVKARLQVTRRDTGTSRRTPDDFRFDEALQPGRIPEGRLLGRDLKLDWNELS
ncbi:hypothetical protein, partial [Bradyrhizobium diazoefficiens]|uniref:hypothetical protein n=1 Tax=Bradyrhizobium diazoefficiens TaxID=1355477 RepID=UPI0005764FD9